MHEIAIIGGGLAGLVSAGLLGKKGYHVVLFEEKQYPFHRVCGEYISNEVVPFLKTHDLFPAEFDPSEISRFHLSSTAGKSLKMPLDLGGFGISRYVFDRWLADKARGCGVAVHEKERVNDVTFSENTFAIETAKGNYQSKVVIGAFGKRTRLDKDLDRSFVKKRSPYVGIKYHIKTQEVDPDVVALHNFNRGYCGVSKINGDTFNLCYLSHRDNLREYGEIPAMEEEVLMQNPYLKRIYAHSDFLFDKPEVINEISFEPKEPVYHHILMSGDSAGMITPLCGNGMAMAIHSALLLSRHIGQFLEGETNRTQLERNYAGEWTKKFAFRHYAGRKIQKLFGSSNMSGLAVRLGNGFRPFARFLMAQTHGKPFR